MKRTRMTYKCNFPGCDYETDERTQIEYHHIKQVSDGGSNKSFNRVYLCPNHHTKIHIPEAKHGQHKVKGKDSMIIEQWLTCTMGARILVLIDNNGVKQYVEDKNINK